MPEHVARGRASWDDYAPEWVAPPRRDWAREKPWWGIFTGPELSPRDRRIGAAVALRGDLEGS